MIELFHKIESIFSLTKGESIFLIIVLTVLLAEEIFRLIKARMKKRIYSQYADVKNPEATEFYIEYYKKSQVIDLIRVFLPVGVIIYFILLKAPSAFNFFAIATGAMIVIFKDFILSFLAFFFIVSQYKIGDTISIIGATGEIIYIRPLYVGILGRDENTEHTGELHVVPNNKFFSETVKKEELNILSYRKQTIDIPYDPSAFSIPFEEFLRVLEEYLTSILPLRNAKKVGNYRSFIGNRYKIDFSYDDHGNAHIMVRFVDRPGKIGEYSKKIVVFVEGYKVARERSHR